MYAIIFRSSSMQRYIKLFKKSQSPGFSEGGKIQYISFPMLLIYHGLFKQGSFYTALGILTDDNSNLMLVLLFGILIGPVAKSNPF